MTALPALSRAVDRGTGLAGLLVLAVAVAGPGAAPPWQAWLALPVIVLAGHRPLVLPTARSSSLVIGLDAALLVLLGLSLPLRQALVVWAVAIVAGELSTRRSLDTRLFNAGVCVLCGALALGILSAVPPGERTAPTGLLGTVMAAGVYFGADYLWSAVSVALAQRASLRETLQAGGLLLALACFLAVNSLGFVAAVVLRAEPWAVGLLAIPFVSLLLATHSWSELRRVQQRSAALSSVAVALQQATSLEQVEQLVVEHAPAMVRAPSAEWADGDADGSRLIFTTPESRRLLVVAPRPTGEELSAPDVDALRMLLGVAEQAHERLRLLSELRRSAQHDPLTGLANRTVLHDALADALRQPEGVALLYCDLDGFKAVNDTLGHAAGDALLVAVAGRLSHAVRTGDLAVRLGGDEFAVLLRGLAGTDLRAEAEQVSARLCAALAQPYELLGGQAVVPASIGLCVRTGDEQAEDLLQGSDAAMYAAKASGGGRVQVHRPGAHVPPLPVQPTSR